MVNYWVYSLTIRIWSAKQNGNLIFCSLADSGLVFMPGITYLFNFLHARVCTATVYEGLLVSVWANSQTCSNSGWEQCVWNKLCFLTANNCGGVDGWVRLRICAPSLIKSIRGHSTDRGVGERDTESGEEVRGERGHYNRRWLER